MTIRYIDAATVSDEHGKGTEILRQVVFHSEGTENVAFIPEVDCLIRYVRVYRIGSGTGLVIQAVVRNNGASTTDPASAAITLNAANAPRYTPTDIPLTDGIPLKLGQNQILELIIGGAHTNAMFMVGWMPDLWGPEATNKTYILPN